jgi:hypothetical protein
MAAAEAQEAVRLMPADGAEQALFYSVLSCTRLLAGDAAGVLAASENALASPGPNRNAPLLVAAAAIETGNA